MPKEIEKEQIPTEEIEAAIVKLSEGMQKLKSSRLKWSTIVLLIARASNVKMELVDKILKELPDLEEIYLKPKSKSKKRS